MRRILVPVAATTDANGNATITIPLERTGEWRNVKVALSTTAPAEWALSSAGNQVNYGRGRRAVLGPELLEPEDTLVVTVTGGPVKAAISGTASGVAGSSAEIISSYQAAPNTIALDTSLVSKVLGTLTVAGGGQAGTATYPIPPGTLGLAFVWQTTPANLVPSVLTLTGGQSGVRYLNTPPATVLADANEVFTDLDTTVTLNVTTNGSATSTTVTVIGLPYNPRMRVTSLSSTQLSVSLHDPIPSNLLSTQVTAAGTTTLATTSNTFRVFGWGIDIDPGAAGGTGAALAQLQDSVSGNIIGSCFAQTQGQISGYHGGVALSFQASINLVVALLPANMAVRAWVSTTTF